MKTIGQVAYEAWVGGFSIGWRLPSWADLPEGAKERWEAIAQAVVDEVKYWDDKD